MHEQTHGLASKNESVRQEKNGIPTNFGQGDPSFRDKKNSKCYHASIVARVSNSP